jgi:hydroxymethylbilane synthase
LGQGRWAISVRLGTRGSKLALAQAETVSRLLEPTVGPVEIVVIKTSGDHGNREVLGAFVKQIQESLLKGAVDIGLHCLKDLPTEPVPGLNLSAYLEREDPADVILSTTPWRELPAGAVIGTGSLRRSAQLSALRRDFKYKPLVGNVDTRLRKLLEGEYDAIVLAIAGLRRLGLLDGWSDSAFFAIQIQILKPEEMLPAPGQGVLVLETREGSLSELSALDHAPTRMASMAERAFLNSIGGGCSVPVAALATSVGKTTDLEGLVAAPDGSEAVRGRVAGEDSVLIGESLAARLIARGAKELLTRQPVGGPAK